MNAVDAAGKALEVGVAVAVAAVASSGTAPVMFVSQTSSGRMSAIRRRIRSHATRLPIAAARASDRCSLALRIEERKAFVCADT